MDSKEIYLALNRKNLNATMLAEVMGVLPQTVGIVIRNGHGSKRIAHAIAAAIDKPLEDVFPYYAAQAKRKENKERLAQDLKRKIELAK